MNLSTAFNIFARQTLRQGKIPFEIYDPFYSEKNRIINHKYGDEYNQKLWKKIVDETGIHCPCDFCRFNGLENEETEEHENNGGCHSCENHGGGPNLFEWNGELWF